MFLRKWGFQSTSPLHIPLLALMELRREPPKNLDDYVPYAAPRPVRGRNKSNVEWAANHTHGEFSVNRSVWVFEGKKKNPRAASLMSPTPFAFQNFSFNCPSQKQKQLLYRPGLIQGSEVTGGKCLLYFSGRRGLVTLVGMGCVLKTRAVIGGGGRSGVLSLFLSTNRGGAEIQFQPQYSFTGSLDSYVWRRTDGVHS